MDQVLLWALIALVVVGGVAWAIIHHLRHPRQPLDGYGSPRTPDERGRTGGT